MKIKNNLRTNCIFTFKASLFSFLLLLREGPFVMCVAAVVLSSHLIFGNDAISMKLWVGVCFNSTSFHKQLQYISICHPCKNITLCIWNIIILWREYKSPNALKVAEVSNLRVVNAVQVLPLELFCRSNNRALQNFDFVNDIGSAKRNALSALFQLDVTTSCLTWLNNKLWRFSSDFNASHWWQIFV